MSESERAGERPPDREYSCTECDRMVYLPHNLPLPDNCPYCGAFYPWKQEAEAAL